MAQDVSGDRGGRNRRLIKFQTEEELELYQKLMAKFLSSFEKVGSAQETWSDYTKLIENMAAKEALCLRCVRALSEKAVSHYHADEEGIDSKGEVLAFIIKNMASRATAEEHAELILLNRKQLRYLDETESRQHPDVALWLFLQISQSTVSPLSEGARKSLHVEIGVDLNQDHRIYGCMQEVCGGSMARNPEIAPNVTSFELALHALIDPKHYDSADKIYPHIQKSGPQPNTSVLNFMMITYMKNQNPRPAIERLTEAAAAQPHIQSSSRGIVVAAYAWAGALSAGRRC
ncbi:hypothetical protein BJ742DRAFT_771948 [Cladochytrium replicatum]|nr:hypothetical protein BJ742DRAFT_771948 [Cladochytrium replicatum]